MALPAGQTPAPLHRFGLPAFAAVHPAPGPDPRVTVTGAVRRPTQVRLADLLALPGRREQTSDRPRTRGAARRPPRHPARTGPARRLAHPRGRAAHEERSRAVPGPLWRPLWRALQPAVRRRYARPAQSSAR